MRVKKPRTTVVTPKNLLMVVMLMALQRSNSYGYKLMEETKAFWRETINRGTVYRTLRQMEKSGNASSSSP